MICRPGGDFYSCCYAKLIQPVLNLRYESCGSTFQGLHNHGALMAIEETAANLIAEAAKARVVIVLRRIA